MRKLLRPIAFMIAVLVPLSYGLGTASAFVSQPATSATTELAAKGPGDCAGAQARLDSAKAGVAQAKAAVQAKKGVIKELRQDAQKARTLAKAGDKEGAKAVLKQHSQERKDLRVMVVNAKKLVRAAHVLAKCK